MIELIALSFVAGVVVGAAGGYTISINLSNKSQKTHGDKSPNIMGDDNNLRP